MASYSIINIIILSDKLANFFFLQDVPKSTLTSFLTRIFKINKNAPLKKSSRHRQYVTIMSNKVIRNCCHYDDIAFHQNIFPVNPSLRSFRIIGAGPKWSCLLCEAGKCRSAGLWRFVICIWHLENGDIYFMMEFSLVV